MIYSPLQDYPWQKLGWDLFYMNAHNYLVVVDYYSRFIQLRSTTSKAVIESMKSIYSRHGIPRDTHQWWRSPIQFTRVQSICSRVPIHPCDVEPLLPSRKRSSRTYGPDSKETVDRIGWSVLIPTCISVHPIPLVWPVAGATTNGT